MLSSGDQFCCHIQACDRHGNFLPTDIILVGKYMFTVLCLSCGLIMVPQLTVDSGLCMQLKHGNAKKEQVINTHPYLIKYLMTE